MEATQSIRIIDRILTFLSKVKCKITCCCRSSCVMDGQPELPNIEQITEL